MAEGKGGAVDVRGDGGILKTIRKQGEGGPAPVGSTVSVHYAGRLESGEQFDSSRDRGRPLSFTLGEREVILGWDLGVASMRVGERAELRLKPEYGYGQSGAGETIPPNATLIFDVELMSIAQPWEVPKFVPILGMALVGLLLMYLSSGLTMHDFKADLWQLSAA
eukprot:CAMPEP_0197924272 /NCGR_PEP_ID=MMETSP1439-20131203/95418_1 /TAXON_ID=66791 /ORGANISM="Gonyaulax spinifera, Strain CCMP409" /LENGTH=164 /DNA_ID=CAMNT_0043546687 /DNA_START=41 /DNA_END=536 /DNA_ORIENTATION=-